MKIASGREEKALNSSIQPGTAFVFFVTTLSAPFEHISKVQIVDMLLLITITWPFILGSLLAVAAPMNGGDDIWDWFQHPSSGTADPTTHNGEASILERFSSPTPHHPIVTGLPEQQSWTSPYPTFPNHYASYQPAQLDLNGELSTHIAPSPPSEHQLDAIDYHILDTILEDLSQPKNAPPSHASPNRGKQAVASHPYAPLLPHDAASLTSTFIQPEWHGAPGWSEASVAMSIAYARDTRRGPKRPRLESWEPGSFLGLNRVDRVTIAGRGNLIIERNPAVVHAINTQLFAGKMTVISNEEMSHMKTLDYRNMRPTKRTSRLLPFRAPGGIPVYMTDHYAKNSQLTGERFKERGLQGKPHYFFWGVEDLGRTTNIINYGAGYIDTNDEIAVNNHLWPLIEALRSAELGHA